MCWPHALEGASPQGFINDNNNDYMLYNDHNNGNLLPLVFIHSCVEHVGSQSHAVFLCRIFRNLSVSGLLINSNLMVISQIKPYPAVRNSNQAKSKA